ncbi:MAG: galactosyldiacylglycerol synthase [Acidobacteria bacterium]|nr:galactosyldiacylglycerol synthase [Acidobacteriota bacterium]
MDRRLTIVFFDAGGGHRSAAEALKSVLESRKPTWDVALLNLQELLERLDLLKKATGIRIQDGYNLLLRNGWTQLTPYLLPVLQTAVRWQHRPTVDLLGCYWKDHPRDLVLSVIPHFNRALRESLRLTSPGTAFVTVLTDFADYPPHFWMERESEYLICGTERAAQQAFGLGHDRQHVFLASGMVMNPVFYQPLELDRSRERERLGLERNRSTGLVLFGGHGSRTMLDITRRLDDTKADLQLILICGRNQKLRHALERLRTRFPKFVEGFSSEIHYYMALADFFIGKPGPGSISEALKFHLPVIIESNRGTLPQERYNAQWVSETATGIVLTSFRRISQAVEKMLEPSTFARLRANAASYHNRALFEIPRFLDEICARHQSSIPGANHTADQAMAGQVVVRQAGGSLPG